MFGLRRLAAAALASSGRPRLLSFNSPNPWLYTPGNTFLPRPPLNSPPTNSSRNDHPKTPDKPLTDLNKDFAVVSHILKNPLLDPCDLQSSLNAAKIEPSTPLLEAVLQSSNLSAPKILSLLRWCPNFRPTSHLLSAIISILGKYRCFSAAWSILLCNSPDEDSFCVLIRRYIRQGMIFSAIRTYEFALEEYSYQLFDVLLDSLCKEGHARAAQDYLNHRKVLDSGWLPSIQNYNVLINGWFRNRRIKKVEKLWEEIRSNDKVKPSVVTYGTMIEGFCRMGRVDQALGLLEEMKSAGIPPNEITVNPIVDALAEAGRFKEALAAVERFPLLGISPNISTYNSLVKGFCKNGDLVGGSQILKVMMGRGILPTATTYNYFFRFFAREGKIEEGMNLYEKIVQSGYSPDRLTYHLLVKMLCEGKKLLLAAQVIQEMQSNGLDSDLATSSMFVHLLCRTHQFDEACEQFELMIKKGIVPQYLTFRMLVKELNRLGRTEMAEKITALMGSFIHSTKLPDTYKDGNSSGKSFEMKKSVMTKAQAMAESLKQSPKNRSSFNASSENTMAEAKSLISDIRRRIFAVK